MVDSFWKPIKKKPLKKSKAKPFDLRIKPQHKIKKKDLNWPQAKKRYPKMNPLGDWDKDKVKNFKDCKPFDRKKQGFFHEVQPDSKRSMKKFQRYRPQVQTITNRMEIDFVKGQERIRKGIDTMEMRGGRKADRMKLKPLIEKRQEEDVGFFDYASIPGIKQSSAPVKWAKGGKPLYLLVEKGVVKGSAYLKDTSNPRVVEFKNLYIQPEYRRQGVGRRAVASVLKNPKIDSAVGIVIPSAKKKWEKMGAKTKGSQEEYEALGNYLKDSARSMYGMEYEDLPPQQQYEVERIVGDTATSITLEKDDFVKEYQMAHRPTKGPRLSNLKEQVEGEDFAPSNIYDKPEHYARSDIASGGPEETIRKIREVRDNPEKKVKIYRAAPKGAKLNKGDWITLSKEYAKVHSRNEMPIIEQEVSAKDVRWAGDDLSEFGYYPENQREPAPEVLEDWEEYDEED